jgi:hypothetical protein
MMAMNQPIEQPQAVEIPSIMSSPVIVLNDELYIRRIPSDGSPHLIPHSSKKAKYAVQKEENIRMRASQTPSKKVAAKSRKKQEKSSMISKDRPFRASSNQAEISFVIHPEELGGRLWVRKR